jgi:hypothetical protein
MGLKAMGWRPAVLGALLVGAFVSSAQAASGVRGGVPAAIRRFDEVAAVTSRSERDERTRRTRHYLSFAALGKSFELELEPNAIFTAGAVDVWVGDDELVETRPAVELYKGRLRGRRDTWVRVSRLAGALDGIVWTPEEVYFLVPKRRFVAGAGAETIAYRLSDADLEGGACAAEANEPIDASALAGAGGAAAVGDGGAAATYQETELGIVADYEYYQEHGADSAADMQSIINQIDGIYRGQVGVTLKVATTVVYTTSSDPFSSTTDPQSLLNEFSSYRNSSGSPVYGRDLAHLFTNRDLSGSVVGIAWLGTLCSSYYGAGLSQDYTTSNNSLVVLTAHELGHNFGAPHDNQSGSPCGYEPSGYIMNPSVTSSATQFSGCSRTKIAEEVNSVSCLSTVNDGTPTAPPTPTPTATPGVPTATATWTATLAPAPPTPTPDPNGPQAVSGLILWLDASRITGLSDGGAVTTWSDASGNGRHATQSTAAYRPTYRTRVLNGWPAVRFDGLDDYLTTSSLSIPSNATIFVVAQNRTQTSSTDSIYRPILAGNSSPYLTSGTEYALGYKRSGAPGFHAVLSNGSSVQTVQTSAAATEGFELHAYRKSGTSATLYRAGQLVATATQSRTSGMGTGYYIGAELRNSARRYLGDVAEILVYNRALSDAERQQVEGYLAGKYAIAGAPGTPAPTATATNTPPATATPTHTQPPAPTATFTVGPSPTTTNTQPPAATPTATVPAAPTPTLSGNGPQSLSGLIFWVDASQITGLAGGQGVATWSDASGAGKHMAQATATLRPVYIPGVLNGWPVVRFDGVDDYLTNSTLSIPSGATILMVARNAAQTTTGSLYRPVFCGNSSPYLASGTEYAVGYKRGDSPGFHAALANGSAAQVLQTSAAATDAFELHTHVKSGTTGNLYRGGASVATGIQSRSSGFGSGYNLGADLADSSRRYKGDVAEVVVYNRALSDAERQSVENYLRAKYGL